MVELAQFDYEPEEYKVLEAEGAVLKLVLRFDIKELSYEDYWAKQITVEIPAVDDIDAYVQENKRAIIEQNVKSDAAAEARKKRDELLRESDKYMMLDRLDLGSATTFLGFISKIKDIMTGKYARYRQALRDIPQQPGFPLDIEWPEKPEDTI